MHNQLNKNKTKNTIIYYKLRNNCQFTQVAFFDRTKSRNLLHNLLVFFPIRMRKVSGVAEANIQVTQIHWLPDANFSAVIFSQIAEELVSDSGLGADLIRQIRNVGTVSGCWGGWRGWRFICEWFGSLTTFRWAAKRNWKIIEYMHFN